MKIDKPETVLEYYTRNAQYINHTGFCLGKFEVSCLNDCVMCDDCIRLYAKERGEKKSEFKRNNT